MSDWKFKAWSIPQLGMEAEPYEVATPDYVTALIVREALAGYDLYQYENRVKPDYTNMLGIEACHPVHTSGEWEDIDEDAAEHFGFAKP